MELENNVQGTPEEQYQVRIEKIAKMRELGIDPWPAFKPVNATTADVLNEFSDEAESLEYEVAGRILTMRKHGKAAFATIQDRKGTVQVYIKEDIVGEHLFTLFNSVLDIGDTIWCKGKSFRTKTGEITLKVQEFSLLSKCLHPLPEKFHGIADKEIVYRQRYLDLITNVESKDRFKNRSRIVAAMRAFFNQ